MNSGEIDKLIALVRREMALQMILESRYHMEALQVLKNATTQAMKQNTADIQDQLEDTKNKIARLKSEIVIQ